MNTTRRFLTTATAGLGGMIMLSLAANADAQCLTRTSRTFVQQGAVAAVHVAPVVAVAPTTYAPVGSYPVAYPQVITPAPVVVYARPQVVYAPPVVVATPVYRTYFGHTRIITYGGHGHHGRQYGHHYYRRHHYSRHGRHGFNVNFGLSIGH